MHRTYDDERIPPKAGLFNPPEAGATNTIGEVLDRSRTRLS
jgi:hypothetical protein